MYFVHYGNQIIGYKLCKVDTLNEAKELAIHFMNKGYREVYVSQEIPMKITFNLEFTRS
ncbi:hypothetical protein P4V34_28710 [Bacillus thuringiensis]|nr:hypothetical protein [Bacillus thuringiensis]